MSAKKYRNLQTRIENWAALSLPLLFEGALPLGAPLPAHHSSPECALSGALLAFDDRASDPPHHRHQHRRRRHLC